MSVTIQLRGDTAANWTSVNPVLAQRELGMELDTLKLKVGDGVTHWNSLAYWLAGSVPLAGGTMTGELVLPDLKVTGLTGAVSGCRLVGATASGSPVSGTFAVGDAVVDLTGKIWICTTAGTPGSWAVMAGDQPWQFRPETYGAKGDGKLLADGYITSGQNVLSTQGMAAPSAPSPTNSGSGGTVAAGTYQVKVTLVNAYGETLPSAAGSTTTSGSASTITVPALYARNGNATGWNVYMTQAGGSSYTLQNASPVAIGASFTLTAPPTNTGANPPGSNTTASKPFTSADVGKHVLVWIQASSVWLSATIAGFTDSAHVTLSANAPATASCVGVAYGTDDTAAIQAAVNAATAHSQLGNGSTGEVLFRAAIYCVASAAVTNPGNAQIALPPVNALSGSSARLALKGAGMQDTVHWAQTQPPQAGTILLSMRLDGSVDGTYGPPSVIGGPTAGYGGDAGIFSDMQVVIDGLTVTVPAWGGTPTPYCGIDLFGIADANVPSFSYLPLAAWSKTISGGGLSTVWPNVAGGVETSIPSYTFGLRMPDVGNNALSVIGVYECMWAQYGLVGCEHMAVTRMFTQYCFAGWQTSPGGHGASILSWTNQDTTYAIWGGLDNTPTKVFVGMLSIETTTYLVYDYNGILYGTVYFEYQANDPNHFYAASLLAPWTLAQYQYGLKLISTGTKPGIISPPAVPASGTLLDNNYYRDASVYITSGGAAVTAITLDATVTGLTLGTSGTVMVRIPSGHGITLTYASTAPTWVWVLD